MVLLSHYLGSKGLKRKIQRFQTDGTLKFGQRSLGKGTAPSHISSNFPQKRQCYTRKNPVLLSSLAQIKKKKLPFTLNKKADPRRQRLAFLPQSTATRNFSI
ncbi:MAG: hypothetical protein SCI25_02990 [Desulfuromonadales bacterium]|nr:hypothetical protein [Desulfuromonadales bacterium]MDW7757440.1 hypothetical protein [Desulfuromonadales bacterium]